MRWSSPAQLAANKANAERSTGPKTEAGKAASALNNFKFGLTGSTFRVLNFERREEYDQLRKDLFAEWQPSTPTETMLVEKMIQHHWLSLRSLLLQDLCIDPTNPGLGALHCEARLALYLRYQATHERAYYKALRELQALRAERHKSILRFESSQRKAEKAHDKLVADCRKEELRKARLELLNLQIESKKLLLERRRKPQTPVPAMKVTSEPAGALTI